MTISDNDVPIRQSYQLSAQAQLSTVDNHFSLEGYVISAWTENADGTGKRYAPEAELQEDEVSADIQLWAQWASLLTKVTYNDVTISSYNVVGELTQDDIIGGHVKSDIVACEIGYSVTSIAPATFFGCDMLTNVTIPNSVMSIGGCAFEGCSGLTSVDLCNFTDASKIPSCATDSFSYNATDRKFYVASDTMKTAFSTAEGWSSYGADSFVVKTV